VSRHRGPPLERPASVWPAAARKRFTLGGPPMRHHGRCGPHHTTSFSWSRAGGPRRRKDTPVGLCVPDMALSRPPRRWQPTASRPTFCFS